MAEMTPITYPSRDGLTIHGYLTLPKGREAKGLPLVVNPHGGPWARDEWGYNPEIQLLANRGYAVLQMNFRGSTGYGDIIWPPNATTSGLRIPPRALPPQRPPNQDEHAQDEQADHGQAMSLELAPGDRPPGRRSAR